MLMKRNLNDTFYSQLQPTCGFTSRANYELQLTKIQSVLVLKSFLMPNTHL